MSGVHHTHRRAGEIHPHTVRTSNLPKFSFIKIAQGPGRPPLPGSAPREEEQCDIPALATAPPLPPSSEPAPLSIQGFSTSQHPEFLTQQQVQQGDEAPELLGGYGDTGGYRGPSAKNKNQSPTDIMGEGWGRDRQTDKQTKWETHRERATAESKRKRWDYPLPRPPVNTSNSPLAGAENKMGKKEDLLTPAGKRWAATFL